MADFINCNCCGMSQGVKTFLLSSCGHVYCITCRQRVLDMGDVCGVCKVKCKFQELNKDSPSSIKSFFANPLDGLKEHMNQYFRVTSFQKNQFKILLGHLSKKCQSLERERGVLRQEVRMLRKKVEELERSNFMTQRESIPVGNVAPNVFRRPASTGSEDTFMPQSPFFQIQSNTGNPMPFNTPNTHERVSQWQASQNNGFNSPIPRVSPQISQGHRITARGYNFF